MDSHLAPFWKLITKPHRKLIEILAERGALTVNQVVEFTSESRTMTGYHLERLLEAGVVVRSTSPQTAGAGRPPYVFQLTEAARAAVVEGGG